MYSNRLATTSRTQIKRLKSHTKSKRRTGGIFPRIAGNSFRCEFHLEWLAGSYSSPDRRRAFGRCRHPRCGLCSLARAREQSKNPGTSEFSSLKFSDLALLTFPEGTSPHLGCARVAARCSGTYRRVPQPRTPWSYDMGARGGTREYPSPGSRGRKRQRRQFDLHCARVL